MAEKAAIRRAKKELKFHEEKVRHLRWKIEQLKKGVRTCGYCDAIWEPMGEEGDLPWRCKECGGC